MALTSRHLRVLRAAGVFWCAWGAYLLVYSWFRPAGNTLVDIVPPMTCLGYGAMLYQTHRSAAVIGWVFVLIFFGGGAVTGLLRWPPYLAVLSAQCLLAAYTTVIRRHLGNAFAG